ISRYAGGNSDRRKFEDGHVEFGEELPGDGSECRRVLSVVGDEIVRFAQSVDDGLQQLGLFIDCFLASDEDFVNEIGETLEFPLETIDKNEAGAFSYRLLRQGRRQDEAV